VTVAENKKQGGNVIVLTFIIALLLVVFPLPDVVRPYRPEWATLVLIYWCMALPSRVNIGIAWLVGLFIDVLTGTLLGQHAMAMAIVAFVTVKLHKQIRVYPPWQQALSVFTLVALGQLFVVWIKGITGDSPQSWNYWAPSFTSALIWPWVFFVLRDVRRKFRVN
jgi:rod shape-determining protein MreD